MGGAGGRPGPSNGCLQASLPRRPEQAFEGGPFWVVHGGGPWWFFGGPFQAGDWSFPLVLSLSWTTSTLGIQDGQTVVREQEGKL